MPRRRVIGVVSRLPRVRPRIAVLVSSYADSNSETKAHDLDYCTPEHYVPPGFPYRFTYHEVSKKNAHSEVRRLALDEADPVHCFFNLVDGAKEEDRAGVEVLHALKEFNKPFTGPLPENFEPHKVTMKLLVDKVGVKIPPFAHIGVGQDIRRKCRHLRFPVIVKHPSGYASVGITKESKCENMDALVAHASKFIEQHSVALVEEFVTGREGTVLVCRDEKSKGGVRVFPPIIMEFPGGAEDFQSFDNKWKNDWSEDPTKKPRAFDINDPVYPKIIETARRAYGAILQGVGYGRVDFRIDEKQPGGTGDVYFLEINPNCGMFYPPSMGGDYADIMVHYDKDWDHAAFISNQITAAIEDHRQSLRWWRPAVDAANNFVTKATSKALPGHPVFGNAADPSPVILRCLTDEKTQLPGCVAVRADDKSQIIGLRHSCRPNVGVAHGTCAELVAIRRIKKGDILSIDYGTLRDPTMPAFACKCGAPECRKTIRPQSPKLRSYRRPVTLKTGISRAMERRQRRKAAAAAAKGGAATPAAAAAADGKKTAPAVDAAKK